MDFDRYKLVPRDTPKKAKVDPKATFESAIFKTKKPAGELLREFVLQCLKEAGEI